MNDSMQKKKMWTMLGKYVFLAAFVGLCGMRVGDVAAAQLGFEGPRNIMKPAETFVVKMVARFVPGEPTHWDTGSTPSLSINLVWPTAVRVLTCHWNSAAWQFTDRGILQNDNEAMLWARATANVPGSLTGTVVVATLECIAVDSDEDSFYYDTWDISEPYPTAMTVQEDGDLVDILGDPTDPDDGVDELTVGVSDTPGYILTVQPAQRSVPFTLAGAAVGVAIRKAAPAAPYSHVRVLLEYDSMVFTFEDLLALRATVPSFFTNLTVHCPESLVVPPVVPMTTVVADLYDGELVIEAWCAPTNYEGRFVSASLMPQDLADESPIELGFSYDDLGTVVDRLGVDLLGSVLDFEDGTENSYVTVRYVDGLRVALQPISTVVTVGSNASAYVMVRKSTLANVAFDNIDLDLFFDPALLNCTTAAFTPNPDLVGTNARCSVSIATNMYTLDPSSPSGYPWTNMVLNLSIDWGFGEFTSTASEVCLGTMQFTPVATGVVGFLRGDLAITRFLTDIQDDRIEATEWPVALSSVLPAPEARMVFVALVPDTNQTLMIEPGDTARLRVRVTGNAVTNAAYSLSWAYDSNLVELLTSSAIVTSQVMVIGGETSAVLRVQGVATTSATTDLALVEFKALRPGTAACRPVTPLLSPEGYSTFLENDRDVLGADTVAGDGVSGYGIIVQEPEGVGLKFVPAHTLFAGVSEDIQLHVINPQSCHWDRVSADFLFDSAYAGVQTGAWRMYDAAVPMLNTVYTWPEVHEEYGYVWTNMYTRARLDVRTAEHTDARHLASLTVMPIDEDVLWGLDAVMSNTSVALGSLPLTVDDAQLFDEDRWIVYPNGVSIWLADSALPPVLGSNYTLTVRIDNPHGVAVTRTSFCWYFDAAQVEVVSARLLDGWTTNSGGTILVNNHNWDESYVCADLWRTARSTNADFAVLEFTIMPKLNQTIELLPAGILLDDMETEIPLAVWNDADLNVLELMGQYPEDVCPPWRRGVIWVDIPQLMFDDIELWSYEAIMIALDDILLNGEPQKTYRWWVEGSQQHVSFAVNNTDRTLTVASLDDWSGIESFHLCCQEIGSPFVGRTSFRVTLGDGEPSIDLNISLQRDTFRWVTESTFDEAWFNVRNATGAVRVSAKIQYPDSVWRDVLVQDGATDATGRSLDIRNRGRVVWTQENAAPGLYIGCIELRDASAPTNFIPAAVAWFYVELIDPGRDNDGDRFYLIYKNGKTVRTFNETSIRITGGAYTDTLIMKVIRGAMGDGLVNIDSIESDNGFSKIDLRGSVNSVRTQGPIGALAIRGGMLGELCVSNGGIGTVLIANVWDAEYAMFATDVGIVQGVYADGNIGTIAVHGGCIGADDAPAVICSGRGNIGSVTTRALVRGIEIAGYYGADLYASVLAPMGAIGTVTACGGNVGAPYDYPLSRISAATNIRRVGASAMVCDGSPYGGNVYATVTAGIRISAVDSKGGDISRSELYAPEDVADPELLATKISAPAIGKIKSKTQLVYDGFSMSTYGGSIKADILASTRVDSVTANGGDACLQLNVANGGGSIGSIAMHVLSYFEYSDDSAPTWRGGSLRSSTVATTSPNTFKSSNVQDYNGPVCSFIADSVVKDTWIGYKGSADWESFGYSKFKCTNYVNSAIWEAKGDVVHIKSY